MVCKSFINSKIVLIIQPTTLFQRSGMISLCKLHFQDHLLWKISISVETVWWRNLKKLANIWLSLLKSNKKHEVLLQIIKVNRTWLQVLWGKWNLESKNKSLAKVLEKTGSILKIARDRNWIFCFKGLLKPDYKNLHALAFSRKCF